MVLGGRYDHCHEEPNQRNIEKQKVRTEYKWKAEEEPCERPCKLNAHPDIKTLDWTL
jgi:hypothetical protein